MRRCLLALTGAGELYPQFVGLTIEDTYPHEVRLEVRSPPYNGHMGDPAYAILSVESARQIRRALGAFIEQDQAL